MIYGFKCDKCGQTFTKNFSMNDSEDRKKVLQQPCPNCGEKGHVRRDYSSITLTYDILDVRTRARKVAGVGFDEMINNIHKSAGSLSKIQ